MKSIFIIFIGVGILFILLGGILYKFKKIEYLTLYDRNKNYDRDGLAKVAGGYHILMGILVCALSTIWMILSGSNIIMYILIVCIIIVFLSIKISLEIKKYEI